MNQRFFVIIASILLVLFLGKSMNPFDKTMFDFHDETQPARIQQFAFNIKNLQIPPRIAPDFSFKLGYPVFNFYAPASYWITSGIHLLGFDIANSIKLSFLLALLAIFMAMYLFLRLFFPFFSSLIGAALLTSSPWMAVETLIRGNLAETWFFPFFIFSLFFLYKNAKSDSPLIFFMTVLSVFLTLTSHNIFILVSLPVFCIFALIHMHWKKNLTAIGLGIALSSYFLIPAFIELPLTYAKEIAKNTNYQDHFLCWFQFWKTPYWGYGGSVQGCINDGMPFVLGKLQILIGVAGMVLFFWKLPPRGSLTLYILLFTFISAFLSTYSSKFIWDIFSPVLAIFQFPWRFNILTIFGLSFFSASLFAKFEKPRLKLIYAVIIFFVFFINSKYFVKYNITKEKFNENFLSRTFIEKRVVYKVSEYLPKIVDYREWLAHEPQSDNSQKSDTFLEERLFLYALDRQPVSILFDSPFHKKAETSSEKILLNIHYFPFWNIRINGTSFMPTVFDKLGRPVIELQKPAIVEVEYQQTNTEKTGNIITITAFGILIAVLTRKNLWKQISN